ncbi:MAG TPA: hypothetical protein DDW34_01040 [Clostridium sp.]|nr:hypothetical protein [Clostridium sp.]
MFWGCFYQRIFKMVSLLLQKLGFSFCIFWSEINKDAHLCLVYSILLGCFFHFKVFFIFALHKL